jgi:hypothetical protein
MKATRKKISLVCGIVVAGGAYFGLLNHTPHGTECVRSTSPDGTYIAERCFLGKPGFYRSDNGRYVARLFEAKSGDLLVENVFTTPVPDLYWTTGFYAGDSHLLHYIGPAVSYQRGGEDDDGSHIYLPPSFWDRLLARRPRLRD